LHKKRWHRERASQHRSPHRAAEICDCGVAGERYLDRPQAECVMRLQQQQHLQHFVLGGVTRRTDLWAGAQVGRRAAAVANASQATLRSHSCHFHIRSANYADCMCALRSIIFTCAARGASPIFAPRRLLLRVYLALPRYLIPSVQSLSLNVAALYARVEAVKGSFLFCSALFLWVCARICKCARVRWEQHVLQLNKFGKLALGWMESRVGGTKDIDTNFCHHCTLATSAKDVSCFNYFIWSLLGTTCSS